MKTAASVGNPLESTKVDLKENPEADPFSVARNIALRQLSMAPKSRKQLEESLAKRKVLPEIAGPVLDRLTEVGLIDDLAYAGMFVRSRCLTKKVSSDSTISTWPSCSIRARSKSIGSASML